MLRSRQKVSVVPDVSTTAERIRWIVQMVFGGKQGEAARACGISQAVLSKIVRKEQSPGQRVLAAFAAHPRVNPIWLYTGEGEPLVPDGGELSTPPASCPTPGWSGLTLPVTTTLLPGPPQKSPLLLSALRMPVTESEFSPSRYWLSVTADAPAVGAKSEKIAVGDYLLVDPEVDRWSDDPRAIQGKLVILRLMDDNGVGLVLARVDSHHGGNHFPLTAFTSTGSLNYLLKTAPEKPFYPSTQRSGRCVEAYDDPPSPRPQTASRTDGPTPSKSKSGSIRQHDRDEAESRALGLAQPDGDDVVRLEDVVAVCVMLVRM